MSEYSKDTGIFVTELLTIEQILFGLYTEVLIGIELKLEGSYKLGDIGALHRDVAVSSVVTVDRGNLVLPKSSEEVEILLRNMNESQPSGKDCSLGSTSQEAHVAISRISEGDRPTVFQIVKFEPVDSIAFRF